MATINFTVEDHSIRVDNLIELAQGSNNFDTCAFSFDSTWNGFVLYAVMYQNPKNVFKLPLDEANTRKIPVEVLQKDGWVYIGARGEKEDTDETIATSMVVRLPVRKGAVNGNETGQEMLDQSQYEYLLGKVNELNEKCESLTKELKNQGSSQNVNLTTAQINALDGMFKVCAYDDSKDISGAYAAFKTAFGISGSGGEEEPDEPVAPDEPDNPDATVYTITNNLTNCASNNSASSITEGSAYTATLTASGGYTLNGATISVVVNGEDVTDTAYSDCVITIQSVTGNVVITVVAVEESSGDSDEVVMLKNISFDGTSYLDTEVIPESVDYRYVMGIQAPNKDITSIYKNIGGISMRDTTSNADSAYWDIYWDCNVATQNYNADVPQFKFRENCMALNAESYTGADKGDGASSQPYDYPLYYSMDNGSQSVWLNEDCTEVPVTGHFAGVTQTVDFKNQNYYTDDEHPIDSIWLGKVHVTGIMGSLATEANTYAGVKFYCFKVYDTDENLIADMHPAKQGSTVGMWDNVRNKFYSATGMANYEEVSV